MALLMSAASSEPATDKEREDLDAIAALKESASIELKEQGNKYVKLGKKHYSDAIDCYSRAINQNALSDSDQSVLFSNRAHVNLMLGNYRRAITDAEEAIKLCPANVKNLGAMHVIFHIGGRLMASEENARMPDNRCDIALSCLRGCYGKMQSLVATWSNKTLPTVVLRRQ